jgi:hypothetical protein
MVAIVVMSLGLMGIAGMAVVAAHRATGFSVQGTRDGVLLQELNRVSVLPYDSLPGQTGCASLKNDNFSYSRCIAVSDISTGSGYRRVRLVITPASALVRPDTIYVNRAKDIPKNPLGE